MKASNGRLVALEGLSEDALAVQLQLLPAAPHVLVLPRVEAYFADEDVDGLVGAFDARRFVARVHAAAAARRAVALGFLSAPARAQPTVLLHGGTATSHALCIEAIRQHDPTVGGDLAQAARLFDELVAGGLSGLLRCPVDVPSFHPAVAVDPSTRAMRAADALDRETEALQPSTHILDLTIHKDPPRPRARSLDLPIHGDDGLHDLLLLHPRPDSSPGSDCSGSLRATASPTSLLFPPSMRLDALAAQQQEPGRGRPQSRPAHPGASLGLNFLLAASREASVAPSSASTPQTQAQTGPDTPTSEVLPLKNAVWSAAAAEAVDSGTTTTTTTSPKPKLTLETSAAAAPRRQPPPQRKPLPQHRQGLRYTDRGTDALPHEREDSDRSAPLLPLDEDLVICFVQDDDRATGHSSDAAAALDLAIQRCQAAGRVQWQTQTQGRQRQQAGDQRAVSSALPATPTSGHGDNDTAAGNGRGSDASDYDPFAPHQYSTVAQGPRQRPPQAAAATATAPASASGKATRRQPPTPAHTPPLPPDDQGPSSAPLFRTIAVDKHPTAMDLHNALRACLHASCCLQRHEANEAAEAEDENVEQWCPDDTRADCAGGGRCLWATPLLCGQPAAGPATATTTTTARGVDLILVVSSEDDGVPPVLAAHVRRRLDALGAAPHPATGLPCNGRLDIRYLVAQADRAWTAQHARSRAQHAHHSLLLLPPPPPPPPPPPSLLVRAALLLAQLDLYRRTSPAVRFVQLECPPALLGLATALQQLAGADLVQVARLAAAAGRGQSSSSRDAAAGLLLTALSTDADVKAFVEAVRRRLAAASATAAAYYHARPPSRDAGASSTVAAAGRASAALSTATTAAATVATPVLRPSSAADRARSPPASRLVAKTIQVPAAASRRAKAVVAFSGSVDEEKKTAFAESDEDLCERVGGKDVDSKDEDDGDDGDDGDGYDNGDSDRDDADDADSLDLDDLDDLEIRRLMPLYLRDRAALLAAKDAAGATRSWGTTGGAAGAAPSLSSASSFSSTLPAAAPLLPAGRQPKQQQPGPAASGMPEMQQHGTKGLRSSTRKSNSSNNNGQKARRWLGLA